MIAEVKAFVMGRKWLVILLKILYEFGVLMAAHFIVKYFAEKG